MEPHPGKECRHPDCHHSPSYAFAGAAEPLYCASHKHPGHVIVHPSTDRHAKPPAGSMPLDHVPRGLDYQPDVEANRVVHGGHAHCRHSGCTKAPSYGFDGGEGQFCYSHKWHGQVFLRPPGTGGGRRDLGERYHVPRGLDLRPPGPSDPPAKRSEESKRPGGDAMPTSPTARAAPLSPSSAATAKADTAVAGAEKSPLPDMQKARAAIRTVHERREDPGVAVKYLSNILKHPDDVRYRTLKKSNHKFASEVWLNPGMRALFQALGFFEAVVPAGATVAAAAAVERSVVLDPLHAETMPAIASVVQQLAASSARSPGGGAAAW